MSLSFSKGKKGGGHTHYPLRMTTILSTVDLFLGFTLGINIIYFGRFEEPVSELSWDTGSDPVIGEVKFMIKRGLTCPMVDRNFTEHNWVT